MLDTGTPSESWGRKAMGLLQSEKDCYGCQAAEGKKYCRLATWMTRSFFVNYQVWEKYTKGQTRKDQTNNAYNGTSETWSDVAILSGHLLGLNAKYNITDTTHQKRNGTMEKRSKILLVVLLLLLMTVTTVYAETATVTITGGTLSVTAANVALSGVTLDGTDQLSTSASGANSWSASDGRGSGAGWNLTIDSTDFTDGGVPLRTIDISSTDQQFNFQLLDGNIAVTAGNTKPVSQVTTLTAIPEAPAAALKFISAAADTGMGTYSMNPNFELEIPASAYVGTGTYTATITISAVSGP